MSTPTKRPRRNGPPSNVYRRADAHRPAPRPYSPGTSERPSRPADARRSRPHHGSNAPQNASGFDQQYGPRGMADAGPALDCGIKAACGSCQFVNSTYDMGLQQKYHVGLTVLKKSGVVDKARLLAPVPSPKPLEYRSLFKLAVRAKAPARRSNYAGTADSSTEMSDRFAIGLFQPGSHVVVPMDDCPLHTAPLRRLLRDLKYELNKTAIVPFDEATHTGQLRYIAARSAHLTGEIILTFVLNAPAVDGGAGLEKLEYKRLVDTLRRREHNINSAHLNYNAETGNAIFGPTTVRIAGADRLRERLCDLDFEVGPTSFFQINPWQAINLYRRVEQVAGQTLSAGSASNEVAWDLYCGTGQISLILARAGYRVLGIEENPHAVVDADANARKNKLQANATFLAARVEDSHDRVPLWARQPSLIVVNPSRRGIAETTREYLTRLLEQNPRCRFIYVSCEAESMARDLKDLVASGFTVRQIEAFDMFPQTDKMEWIAVLTK